MMETLKKSVAGDIHALRFVPLGSRRSGKTALVGATYKLPALTPADEYTRNAVALTWESIDAGKQILATGGAKEELAFTFASSRGEVRFAFADYDGLFAEKVGSASGVDPASRDWLRNLFRNATGLLFLFPYGEDPSSEGVQQFEQEFAAYIELAKEVYPDVSKRQIPVAVLLTKWDRNPNQLGGLEEGERARSYLLEHGTYGPMMKRLEIFFGCIEVFPVSAFGPTKDGLTPMARHASPHNLTRPFDWLVDRAHGFLAQMLDERITARDVNEAAALAEVLRCELPYDTKGELQLVIARADAFRRRVRFGRAALAAAGFTAIAAGSGLFALKREEASYTLAAEALDKSAAAPVAAQQAVAAYREFNALLSPAAGIIQPVVDLHSRRQRIEERGEAARTKTLNDLRRTLAAAEEQIRWDGKDTPQPPLQGIRDHALGLPEEYFPGTMVIAERVSALMALAGTVGETRALARKVREEAGQLDPELIGRDSLKTLDDAVESVRSAERALVTAWQAIGNPPDREGLDALVGALHDAAGSVLDRRGLLLIRLGCNDAATAARALQRRAADLDGLLKQLSDLPPASRCPNGKTIGEWRAELTDRQHQKLLDEEAEALVGMVTAKIKEGDIAAADQMLRDKWNGAFGGERFRGIAAPRLDTAFAALERGLLKRVVIPLPDQASQQAARQVLDRLRPNRMPILSYVYKPPEDIRRMEAAVAAEISRLEAALRDGVPISEISFVLSAEMYRANGETKFPAGDSIQFACDAYNRININAESLGNYIYKTAVSCDRNVMTWRSASFVRPIYANVNVISEGFYNGKMNATVHIAEDQVISLSNGKELTLFLKDNYNLRIVPKKMFITPIATERAQ